MWRALTIQLDSLLNWNPVKSARKSGMWKGLNASDSFWRNVAIMAYWQMLKGVEETWVVLCVIFVTMLLRISLMFWDREVTKNIWHALLNYKSLNILFRLECKDWPSFNLANQLGNCKNYDWALLWGITFWVLWRWTK